jgi:hypothetical protein
MIRPVPLHTTLRPSRSLLLTAGLALFATLWSTASAHAATFNVKLYGAKGNGTTDDSEAIAKAITAASGGANTVFFPIGTYLIGNAAPMVEISGLTLRGEYQDNDRSVLNFSGSNSQIVLSGPTDKVDRLTIANTGSSNESGIVGSGLQNYSIDLCSFTGWKGNSVKVTNSSGTLEENSFVVKAKSNGILLDGCPFTRINDNKFTASDAEGVGVSFQAKDASNRLIANKNNFSGLKDGIAGSGGASPSIYLGTIEATSNQFESGFFAVHCKGLSALSLNSNTFKSQQAVAISAQQTDQATILQNTINVNSNGSAAGAIFASAGHTSLTISGNKIENFGQIAIHLRNNPNLLVQNNTFSGANFQSTTIFLDSCEIQTISNTLVVTSNNITGGSTGIISKKCRGLVESFNTIKETRFSGILSDHDFSISIESNNLHNCALQPGGPDAVIFVDPAGEGQFYSVATNKYTGNTENLTYFIHVKDAKQHNVEVTGNITNTLLPSKP